MMTMPHLMNCGHRDDGHCLDCVEAAGEERESLRAQLATAQADLARVAAERDGAREVLSFGTLRAANVERNKHWDPAGVLTLIFRSNELSGENGELANIVKKIERERLGLRGSRATLEQLAEEAADVLISLDLLCMTAGIDLDAATVAKFNATSEKYGLPVKLTSHPTPEGKP